MTPLVWLLFGGKAGDNTQIQTLADCLGWRQQPVRLHHRNTELLSNLLLRRTLLGLTPDCRQQLQQPWPDLIISAGRRSEPVARWIRHRASLGGQQVHLVHIGRPWAHPVCFDLVLTTPQYQVPAGPRVVTLELPLHPPPGPAEADALTPTAAELALPRPWLAVLLGGNSGAFVFTPDRARVVAAQVNRLARAQGATVLVSTSARTPARTTAAFLQTLDGPHLAWHWQPGASDNPYQRWLALADQLAVTGDSASMLTEAAATGKAVHLLDISTPPPWWRHRSAWHWRPLSHRMAQWLAPARLRRDVRRLYPSLTGADGAADRKRAATAVRRLYPD